MPASLRDLQRRFATSLAEGSDRRVRVYASTVRANYRNAMAATYRVVRELTGPAFFDTAVDAFVLAHPSTCGDLNLYGAEFASFLGIYPYAREVPYVADVARLEWAIDEASRAADTSGSRETTLATLAPLTPDELIEQRFALDPSCRLVHSRFPLLRIWQAHQGDGDFDIDFAGDADHLLVRRESASPSIERLSAAEYAWLDALARGNDLASALEGAFAVDPEFDVGDALGRNIAKGVLTAA